MVIKNTNAITSNGTNLNFADINSLLEVITALAHPPPTPPSPTPPIPPHHVHLTAATHLTEKKKSVPYCICCLDSRQS